MSRDSYPSYLSESLDNIHHYINYRGRNYQDLCNLQKAVDDLNLAINQRLNTDFRHIPEVAKSFKVKHN